MVWSPARVNEVVETKVGVGPDIHSLNVTVVSLIPAILSQVAMGELGGSVSLKGARTSLMGVPAGCQIGKAADEPPVSAGSPLVLRMIGFAWLEEPAWSLVVVTLVLVPAS